MDAGDPLDRLSRISTLWSVLRQAHEGAPEAVAVAQQALMRRYGEAVRRYLLASVRDAHLADELLQEFALTLVRGGFHGADPQRGRFRDYVKGCLFHLISRHRRAEKKAPPALAADHPALADLAAPEADADREFTLAWRQELLARAWDALADAQPTFYAVLRFRADHPKMPSAEMAEKLGRRLEKALTADGVRQALHRARELYSDLLLAEVAETLESPDADRVEEEMRDLDLLAYCQDALERYRRRAGQ